MEEKVKKPVVILPKNAPYGGKLYRVISEEGEIKSEQLVKGDIVMVTTEDHLLVEKKFPNNDTVTTVSLWKNLEVLHGEKILSFHGAPNELWYQIFEAVD